MDDYSEAIEAFKNEILRLKGEVKNLRRSVAAEDESEAQDDVLSEINRAVAWLDYAAGSMEEIQKTIAKAVGDAEK